MGFLSRVLDSLLGKKTPAVAAPNIPEPPPPAVIRPRVAITWQEIVDSAGAITGYCLRSATLRSGMMPTGSDLFRALEVNGVRRLCERWPVVLPILPGQWLSADFASLVSSRLFFLCQSEPKLSMQDWLAWVRSVRASGGRIACDPQGFDCLAAAGVQADMVVIPAQAMPMQQMERWLLAARQQAGQCQFVADGVETWSEQRYLRSLGVRLCIGQFASSLDEETQVEKISQSRMVLIELLNLLRREADVSEVAALARRDPAVVMKLIEMANSPLQGLGRLITGIEEAILLLGRDALYRWIALTLFRIDPNGKRDETLLAIALSRAAFLEKLVPTGDRRLADELFLVGLFSVVDSLLRLPLPQVLAQISLPTAVRDVLLQRSGIYARYFALMQAMERCRIEEALVLADSLALDAEQVLSAYAESMQWATLAH